DRLACVASAHLVRRVVDAHMAPGRHLAYCLILRPVGHGLLHIPMPLLPGPRGTLTHLGQGGIGCPPTLPPGLRRVPFALHAVLLVEAGLQLRRLVTQPRLRPAIAGPLRALPLGVLLRPTRLVAVDQSGTRP